ncbi:MAG: flippase activity-associated protein Agl23, partial [Blastocatellia bacterium]
GSIEWCTLEATVSTNSDDSEPAVRPEALRPARTDFWWAIAAAIVVALAAFIRLYRLDLVPLHHDEGVNGYFLTRLFHQGFYRYDPANYHGPTLYYLALPFVLLLGMNTFAIRCVTVVFGVGIVWLVLELRREMGRTGALAAALLIAVSPGAVYFSRYFIHETIFVFLTMGILVAGLRYRQTRTASSVFWAAGCIGLLVATKETAVITLGVFLVALVATWLSTRFVKPPPGRLESADQAVTDEDARTSVSDSSELADIRMPVDVGGATNSAFVESDPEAPVRRGAGAAVWAGALALIAILFVCFYSSFFTNPHGIIDGLKALGFWARTAKSEHTHPWNAYLKWLWQMEGPLTVLAGAGGVIAIFRRDSVSFFIALWAGGALAAYSIVPYKTPWLGLNFIPPLALLAGTTLEAFLRLSKKNMGVVAVVLGAAVALSGYRSIRLNFFEYDNDKYAYVYAHTRREFLDMVSEIYSLAERSGQGKDCSIAVVSQDYWPLPWYLRDYTHVAYYGKATATDAELVIAPALADQELRSIFGDDYRSIGVYTLRPGVDLALYIRETPPASK